MNDLFTNLRKSLLTCVDVATRRVACFRSNRVPYLGSIPPMRDMTGDKKMEAVVLAVRHEHVDGWHTYTSPQMPGLFVTGTDQDAEELYASLPVTIEALVQPRYGANAVVKPAPSYHQEREKEGNKTPMDEIIHFVIASHS